MAERSKLPKRCRTLARQVPRKVLRRSELAERLSKSCPGSLDSAPDRSKLAELGQSAWDNVGQLWSTSGRIRPKPAELGPNRLNSAKVRSISANIWPSKISDQIGQFGPSSTESRVKAGDWPINSAIVRLPEQLLSTVWTTFRQTWANFGAPRHRQGFLSEARGV